MPLSSDAEQRNPGLFYLVYPQSLSTGKSGSCEGCVVTLCPLLWKGSVPIPTLLPGAQAWALAPPELNLQLALQLHTVLPALNIFLNKTNVMEFI